MPVVPHLHREVLELRDGGQVSLDWLMNAREPSNRDSECPKSANESTQSTEESNPISNGVSSSKPTSASCGTADCGGPTDLKGVIVLVLPGLTGSSQSEYVKGLVLSLTRLTPATCVVLNNRGTGGIKLMVSLINCNE